MTMIEESEGLLKGWKVEIIATDLNDRSHRSRSLYEIPSSSSRRMFALFAIAAVASPGHSFQARP
jgi:hypothetical protein